MKAIKAKFIALFGALAVMTATAIAAPAAARTEAVDTQRVAQQVRRELVTLPFTGVFDNLAYQVEGSTVTLYGQVVRPSSRSDAARRVARIEGVERVVNHIEVLPLSSFDDRIRLNTYRSVFNTGGLYRYAMGANPSVRIIVNRGHVTLEGVVANTMDKQLAYMAASSVPGVFSVRNNLRAESEMQPVR